MSAPTVTSRRADIDLGALRKRAAESIQHPLTRVLLVLTFTTGLVDAVSFLGLGRVFTANMTGNVAFLSFGIAGAGGLSVVAPLVSVCAFVVGARTGGVLAAKLAGRYPDYVARALAIEICLLGAAAILVAVIDIRLDHVSAYTVIATLALAMGMRTATTRQLNVPDLLTTILTRTLTGLVADGPLLGPSRQRSIRRTAVVLAFAMGALAGALLVNTSIVLPLALASALALAVRLTYVPGARRGD
jgi:uncharacterized membrane protein YoaK (UPF0700 family)